MQASTWGEQELDGAASSTDNDEEAGDMILKFNFQDLVGYWSKIRLVQDTDMDEIPHQAISVTGVSE